MKKEICLIGLLLLLVSFELSAHFAGGTGTVNDPWQIETAEHLSNITNYLGETHANKYYILRANINLGESPWNEEAGWQPIGNSSDRFQGRFNGGGYTINNLTINRSDTNYQGLFGYIRNAHINNLFLVDVDIDGAQYTGAVAGYIASSNVTGSYVTGIIRGTEYTGAFAGVISYGNDFWNNYSLADVQSSSTAGYVGGITGWLDNSTLGNCYSTGKVSFQGTLGYIGALAGYITGETAVLGSFWNYETSGLNISAGGGTAKNTVELLEQNTFGTWDFVSVWDIGFDGSQTYPFLRMQSEPINDNYPDLIPPGHVTASASTGNEVNLFWDTPTFGEPQSYNVYKNNNLIDTVSFGTNTYRDTNVANLVIYTYNVSAVYDERVTNLSNNSYVRPLHGGYEGGIGSKDNPYLIANPQQFDNVRQNPFAHFLQVEDIDLIGFENWQPIGTSSANEVFVGSYDGNGYEITNMRISSNFDYRGLFGYIGFGYGALLKNIMLTNVDVTGRNQMGGLVGRSNYRSIIENCYVSGTIVSNGVLSSVFVGGLVGYNENGTVRNSAAVVNVIADKNYVGGLIGYNYEGTIESCYSKGSVEGNGYVGGLAGYHRGVMTDSYTFSNVSGMNDHIGGAVGNASFGDISNTYSVGRVSGPQEATNVGGLVGLYSSGNIYRCYWNTVNSGQTFSPVGEGRTTTDMTFPYASDTYVDWDFNEIWVADEESNVNNGYPYLQWQPIEPDEKPKTAETPQPADGTENVSVSLDSLNWQYIEDSMFTNPVGFRLYMNNTGEFNEESPFTWINYVEEQTYYTNSELLVEPLAYNTTYYWKVVPTTSEAMTYSYSNRNRLATTDAKDRLVMRNDADNVPVWSFTTEKHPYPMVAVNPTPEDNATGVSTEISFLSWYYYVDVDYADPVGFRVYMNDTGEFDETSPFAWVDYTVNWENYSSSDIISEPLNYSTTYYWKVVPTTILPSNRSRSADRSNDKKYRGDAIDVSVWSFTTEEDTSVESYENHLITVLNQNYPNPFNPKTNIRFTIAEAGEVVIGIYNVKGQKIIELVNNYFESGMHTIVWDGKDANKQEVGSGIYFYRMKNGIYSSTGKMIMMK